LPFLFALLFCFIAACKTDNTPYGNNKVVGKYYRIRGINMYAEVYGQGKPLLMIHGNDGSINTFKSNIAYLAQSYQVIVADSRSQGHSQDLKDSLSFEMMADDYAALLDSLHATPAFVFGWSDGGITGLVMAIRHPEKVAKLATSGANLWPGKTAIVSSEWIDELKDYNNLKNKPPKNAAGQNHWKMVRLDIEEPHISLSELHSIQCPAFIICGEHDMVRREHTQLIYNNILHANMWVIPNADHFTINEHTRIFNSRLAHFFAEQFHD
jgi:pimeloyl-ACP methyl ester carboxylesterase